MDVVQVLGVGLIGVITAGLVKKDKPEFFLFIILATGIIVLIMILDSISEVLSVFYTLVDESGINNDLFSGVLKIIGIGYLTEYSASICTDYGATSVANKLQLAGKVAVFLMSVPIITALVDTIKMLL